MPSPKPSLLRQALRFSPRLSVCVLTVVVSALFAAEAHASDKTTIQAVLTSQLDDIKLEKWLNTCLAKSPKKDTPCIVARARRLAAAFGNQITTIKAAMDGTETACVVTVTNQQLAYLKLWRAAGLLIAANKRHSAKQLMLKSIPISDAQGKIEPGCFSAALAGGGGG